VRLIAAADLWGGNITVNLTTKKTDILTAKHEVKSVSQSVTYPNHIHLISEVAKENGYLRSQSAGIIETLLELIKSKLVSGEDVLISGFGKFCVKEKRERRGRNPATGEDMMLKARKVVTFKCSGQLREKICNPHQ